MKFSRALPFAFTEYGAVALANVLASAQAVEMGIYVVRAFVHLREALATNADVAKRLGVGVSTLYRHFPGGRSAA